MIEEFHVALLISVAYLAPHIDTKGVTMLTSEEVFKLVEMHNDEVAKYIKANSVKTIPSNRVLEEAYVLCNDILIQIGVFGGGCIPSEYLLKYKSICNKMVMLHTHPIPLPIPTPEDLVSMHQIGYDTECILSRTSDTRAKMICIESLNDFDDVLNSMHSFAKKIYNLIDRYIIVEDVFGIQFLPYPSSKSLQEIEKEFISFMKRKCRLSIVSLDMDKKEYDINTIS